MSSLFDVPAQLVMILSLAGSGTGEAPPMDAPQPTRTAIAAAEGPLAFSEQVWLEALKCGAGGDELAAEAARVFRTSGQRYYVPSEEDRQRILGLRRDQKSAVLVALGFARRNAGHLEMRLARAPTRGELYLTHAFGSETAVALVKAAEASPQEPVSRLFPDIVAAHPELSETRGRKTTVADAVVRLKRTVERQPSGAEVAVWFGRGSGFALAGDLKGRARDEVELSAQKATSQPQTWGQAWSTSVYASPDL